jgi:RimJ/RimL family protein N-acetyltransferase
MSDEVGPKSIVDIQNIYKQFLPPQGRLFMGAIRPIDTMDPEATEKFDEAKKKELSELVQIGVVAFCNIDAKNKSAEIFGGIGYPEMREKGYGIDAMKTLIAWGRKELGLHRIYAYCREENKLAVNSLQTAGFTMECHMKDAVFHGGKFENKILLANTPKELKDKHGNIYYAS